MRAAIKDLDPAAAQRSASAKGAIFLASFAIAHTAGNLSALFGKVPTDAVSTKLKRHRILTLLNDWLLAASAAVCAAVGFRRGGRLTASRSSDSPLVLVLGGLVLGSLTVSHLGDLRVPDKGLGRLHLQALVAQAFGPRIASACFFSGLSALLAHLWIGYSPTFCALLLSDAGIASDDAVARTLSRFARVGVVASTIGYVTSLRSLRAHPETAAAARRAAAEARLARGINAAKLNRGAVAAGLAQIQQPKPSVKATAKAPSKVPAQSKSDVSELEDLDEEDRQILAEVAKKGYYHGRPKTGAAEPPQRLDGPARGTAGAIPKRADFDAFQKKWDQFDDERFVKGLEKKL
eukprot:gnl/TRDRNA2_/TRDRNA2_54188_c0_seq1.p1 gnl/TRDRNA2_/TRDRNA2_54188_c0~~gnl/TRDRNA2_/TRDRNA2_54188_c0_seq1.p1  ORF type:complete len:379 (+),score=49.91 gnl/TRDRNA2_/TRDRNA2_54188_c0_seq1:93-1139(+)